LSESYRDSAGEVHQHMIMGLGKLLEFREQSQLNRLIEMLNDMILHHQLPFCDNPAMEGTAYNIYEELKRLNRIKKIKRMEKNPKASTRGKKR